MSVPDRVRDIIRQVANEHRCAPDDILSHARSRSLAYARWDAWFRVRQLRNWRGEVAFSYPQIGNMFGKDHSSVLYGVERWPGVAEKLGFPIVYGETAERAFHLKEAVRLQEIINGHLARVRELDGAAKEAA